MYDMHELRLKTRQELLSLISESKGKLLALRFETATGQLTETHLIKNTKKDIAKIFTVLKEQEKGIVVKEKALPEKSSKKRFGKKEVSALEPKQVVSEQVVSEKAPIANVTPEVAIAPVEEPKVLEEQEVKETNLEKETFEDKKEEVSEVEIEKEGNS